MPVGILMLAGDDYPTSCFVQGFPELNWVESNSLELRSVQLNRIQLLGKRRPVLWVSSRFGNFAIWGK